MARQVSLIVEVIDELIALFKSLTEATTPPDLPPMDERNKGLWRQAMNAAKKEFKNALEERSKTFVARPGGRRRLRPSASEARKVKERLNGRVREIAERKYRELDPVLAAAGAAKAKAARGIVAKLSGLLTWHRPALERMSRCRRPGDMWRLLYFPAMQPLAEHHGFRDAAIQDLLSIRLRLEREGQGNGQASNSLEADSTGSPRPAQGQIMEDGLRDAQAYQEIAKNVHGLLTMPGAREEFRKHYGGYKDFVAPDEPYDGPLGKKGKIVVLSHIDWDKFAEALHLGFSAIETKYLWLGRVHDFWYPWETINPEDRDPDDKGDEEGSSACFWGPLARVWPSPTDLEAFLIDVEADLGRLGPQGAQVSLGTEKGGRGTQAEQDPDETVSDDATLSAEKIAAKLTAFGFQVKEIDGHNWEAIFEALSGEAGDQPTAVVARTVKGWGVNEFQRSNYHGKPIKPEQLDEALADLDAKAAELEVSDLPDTPAVELTAPTAIERPVAGALSAGSFAEALTAVGLESALEAKKLATRRAYGAALTALGVDPRVVAMDGDVKNSTFAEFFANAHPDRYFEGRIAEQNMVSAAAGFSAAEKIPFISSFAKFLTRAYDQLEMAVISNANIKLCGSHAGVSLAADGPSQMGLPDLGFMRTFAKSTRVDGAPAMRIFHPCDAVSAFKLTELMANLDGICYMRTHRPDVPFIYEEDEEFTVGGFKHLVDGEDLAIVASGYMVHVAKAAVQILDEQAGLSATLIDVYSMPLEAEEILRIGDDCRGQILVVEDNYAGGFADEIAAAAATSDLGVMVNSMYVRSVPKSAKTPEAILEMVKLSAQNIADAAQGMFDQSEA